MNILYSSCLIDYSSDIIWLENQEKKGEEEGEEKEGGQEKKN